MVDNYIFKRRVTHLIGIQYRIMYRNNGGSQFQRIVELTNLDILVVENAVDYRNSKITRSIEIRVDP
jgi:hypothetical protein